MQSDGNNGKNMRGKLVFSVFVEKVRLFVAIIVVLFPFATTSIHAQNSYNAHQDGQWIQLTEEEFNAIPDDLKNELQEYYGGPNIGENRTWGETTQNRPRDGFYFPGGGENDDTVNIGGYNIKLGISSLLREALENDNFSLELPSVFQIGELTIGSGSLTLQDSSQLFIGNTLHLGTGSITIENDSELHIGAGMINEGAVINQGTIRLYGEKGGTILQSSGSFDNSGKMIVANGTANFGNDVGYSGSGNITLDGNAVLEGKMQLDHGSEITVYGPNNLINAQDMVIGIDNEGKGQFVLASENRKGEVRLTGELKFDGNATTRELVLRGLFADVDASSYANIDRTYVQDGAFLMGNGHANTSFLFTNGSYHDARGTQQRQVFTADEINYGDSSTIYLNIGSANYDKIMANAISFAENRNDRVNIVLFNLDGHSAQVNAHDIFSIVPPQANPNDDDDTSLEHHQTPGIQLGGEDIVSAIKSLDTDSNSAELRADNGGRIVFQSGSYTGNDMLRINNILIGESSQTLGVDVTGMVYDPNSNPKPWDGFPVSPNTNLITSTIIDSMYGTRLYQLIAWHAGNDLGAFLDIASALDPAIISVETAMAQNNTMQFNRLVGNRFQTARSPVTGYGGFAAQSNSPDVYRAQNRRSGYGSSVPSGSFWFEGLTAYLDQGDIDGMTGFSGETYGFGVGYDRRLNRQFLVGIAFGGNYTSMIARQNEGTSKNDNYIGSLYGSYDIGSMSVGLSGGYSTASIKSRRVVPNIGEADGKRDGNAWYASTEIAYRLDAKKCYLTPFYRFDFVGWHEDAFTETGQNIPMSFSARDDNGYLQTVGLRFGTQFTNVHEWKIIPELTAGWIHDYGDGKVTSTAQFVQGGPAFVLNGISHIKNRALVGLGLQTAVTPQCSLFGKYHGELANKYCKHAAQVGMSIYF